MRATKALRRRTWRERGEASANRPSSIAIATNNGEIGGGEVMLLNIAQALREIGFEVLVLGPSEPHELIDEAEARGFSAQALPASGRRDYIRALWRWRQRNRRIPLWCNGLVPSFATAGIGPRIVHLHILPTGMNAVAALIARIGARRVLVPSRFMASKLRRATVFENWTEELSVQRQRVRNNGPVRIGFLGRLTRDKGVHVLAHAFGDLIGRSQQDARLVLAGDARFGDVEDEEAISHALQEIDQRVERIGWVSREEFFADVDLAVFPSVWHEPFGLVVAEAMAAEVPFVITDAGALAEVAGVDHPWVARRGDPADLSRVVQHALSRISAGDAERASCAYQRWSKRYSPSAGTERVAALLSGLADSSGAGR